MVEFLAGSILLWLLALSKMITNVEGSSERSKPIKQIFYITDVQVDVQHSIGQSRASNHSSSAAFISGNKRTMEEPLLCSRDSFNLHFSISQRLPPGTQDGRPVSWNESSKERFTLFLKPINSEFLHPNAKISYQSANPSDPNQSLYISKPLISDEVLAYSGSVIQRKHSTNTDPSLWQSLDKDHEDPRFNSWATILVHHPYGRSCVDTSEKLTFEGAFEVHNRVWHIKSLQSYQTSRGPHDPELASNATATGAKPELTMVAWSNSDEWVTTSSSEEYSQVTRNDTTLLSASISNTMFDPQSLDTQNPAQHYLQKRQTLVSDIAGPTTPNLNYGNTIGSTDGCPKTLKMVYMGIAVDCTYIRKYGSVDSVRLAVLNNMNTVSSLYQRTFNVSLGIVEINIPSPSECPLQPLSDLQWNTDCPSSPSGGLDLEQRLNQFSQWRAKKGSSDGAGLWHLMTDCPNGSAVGLSWLGALCKVSAETGVNGGTTSGTGVTATSPNEWQTMAHEIGHSFGAVHDCTAGCSEGDSCCPATTSSCNGNKQYIMAPSSTDDSTSLFSPCTIGNICSSLKPGNPQGVDSSCVSESGQHYTIALNQCGNGILEPGEDCDPGAIYSPCCQWGVCKFSPGSVCMPSPNSPCCSSTCQFAPSATPCNSPSSTGQCSGNSPRCSSD